MPIINIVLSVVLLQIAKMTSITDPTLSDGFTSAMEETHNKQLKTYEEIIDMTAELCQAHTHSVKSALGRFETLFIGLHLVNAFFPRVYIQFEYRQ